MRGVHFFFYFTRVHSLWKAETVAQDPDTNSTSSFIGRHCLDPGYAVSEALSKELDSSTSFDDDHQNRVKH